MSEQTSESDSCERKSKSRCKARPGVDYLCPDEAKPLLTERLALVQALDRQMEDDDIVATLVESDINEQQAKIDALTRRIAALCCGDGTALWVCENGDWDECRIWIDSNRGFRTTCSPLMQMVSMTSKAANSHVLHESATGRTFVFYPKPSETIAVITSQIQQLAGDLQEKEDTKSRKRKQMDSEATSLTIWTGKLKWEIQHLVSVCVKRTSTCSQGDHKQDDSIVFEVSPKTSASSSTTLAQLIGDEATALMLKQPFLFLFHSSSKRSRKTK